MTDYEKTIYKVTVTDLVLWFDRLEKPDDFDEKAEAYGTDLNGIYLGYRQYDADSWYLRRDTRRPAYSTKSYREWRLSMGDGPEGDFPYYCSYAWEPRNFYKYKGGIYLDNANFL